MVYRIFVEKKEGLDNEAKGILNEAIALCGEWPKLEDGEVYKAAELALLKEKSEKLPKEGAKYE